jgi:hypothetical protein
MSTKEEKPTLAGVNVKTRKRNIVVPADPGSFATAIVQIFQVGGGPNCRAAILPSFEHDFIQYHISSSTLTGGL